MREEFLSCYNEVFNKDGNIKVCGRDKCIELIQLSEKICPETGKFGSKKTGYLNVEEIKKLKKFVFETF